jgi:hypothetical protein
MAQRARKANPRTRILRAHLSRLKSIDDFLKRKDGSVEVVIYQDFVDVINQIGNIIQTDLSFLYANVDHKGVVYVNVAIMRLRVSQALSYIGESLSTELATEQTSMILGSLIDKELRARCADLLLADAGFDRAVNQATLVLEERIRRRVGNALAGSLTAADLTNKMIKGDPSQSILILSGDAGEQRGFADIIRGIMAAHRNPTHHSIYDISQLDAARICAYIDVLLEIIDNAKVKPPTSSLI